MEDIKITENIKYIGVNDEEIRLFESQFFVPKGMSYNSYLIKDNKNVILDTVDKRRTEKWLENLEKELNGEQLDYIIISHLEPDHAYNIGILANKYPNMKLVGNQITFNMLPNFFNIELEDRKVILKEGDILDIGKHKLQFFMAPMVHWPEVMVTYEQTEKILFSADGFGKFGIIQGNDDWTCEARRYYFGIVGKYGKQVQDLLKKVINLDINMICPLHGPILKENLEYYINKYNIWSSYKAEDEGILIAYASIHGNTKNVALKMFDMLKQRGIEKISIINLVEEDMTEAIENAFRYDKMILAAPSYNMDVFPPMKHFLEHLKSRNYQSRKVGIVENGSWAPSAGKCIKNILQEMKDIDIMNQVITIKSTMKTSNVIELEKLIDEILEGGE